jgi:hypothetical protein
VSKSYTSPSVETLGSVHELTAQLPGAEDKIGSSADVLTTAAAALGIDLDGKFTPDA